MLSEPPTALSCSSHLRLYGAAGSLGSPNSLVQGSIPLPTMQRVQWEQLGGLGEVGSIADVGVKGLAIVQSGWGGAKGAWSQRGVVPEGVVPGCDLWQPRSGAASSGSGCRTPINLTPPRCLSDTGGSEEAQGVGVQGWGRGVESGDTQGRRPPLTSQKLSVTSSEASS